MVPQTRYPLNQCALFNCSSKRRLESLLFLKQGSLKNLQSLYQYYEFEINKKHSAEKRNITAPNCDLKQIQKRILHLLSRIERPSWLYSGERGKSYIDNGKAHLNSKYLLTMDIKSFYDNCTRDPVYRFFRHKLQTSPDIAKILTDIVTYKGGIPTGCPTSQLIAFYAYEDMFFLIADIAKSYHCTFSLYVDDMTFSSIDYFNPHHLQQKIDIILRKYGHRPKYKKINFYTAKDAKPVTGTIITPTHILVPPNTLQHSIYSDFKTFKQFRNHSNLSSKEKELLNTLKGRIQAAQNIQSDIFPGLSRQVQIFVNNS